MAESLENFIARQLREVTESGKNTRAIRLCVAETGETFERWDAPLRKEEGGIGPDEIAETIMGLIRGYAEDFPDKAFVQMSVICEDGDGNTRAKWHHSIRGQNKDAKRSILGGDTSIAEGARVHVETTKQLLNTMVANYNLLGQQLKLQMDSNHDLMVLLMEARLQDAERAGEKAPIVSPEAMEMFGTFLEKIGPIISLIDDAKSKKPAISATIKEQTNG